MTGVNINFIYLQNVNALENITETIELCAKLFTSNGINFIEENDAGLLCSCHFKQFTNHSCSLEMIKLIDINTKPAT